jgi:hypothetical protein
MNKTLNTILFVLIATIASAVILLTMIVVPLLLIGIFFGNIDPNISMIISMILFSASFIGGFFVYSLLLNLVRKKIDLEKYLHPILSGKKKQPPKIE